jgi:hypothetical protein
VSTVEPQLYYHSFASALPGLPGVAYAASAVASFEGSATEAPKVRKNFPESWIFDNIEEYVSYQLICFK